jgi:hypothetical protein
MKRPRSDSTLPQDESLARLALAGPTRGNGASEGIVVVSIPIRLRSVLNGSHCHWRVVARERSSQRAIVRWTLLTQQRIEGPWEVTIVRQSRGTLDSDNLQASCKSIRDEIADWIGVDDSSAQITWIYKQEKCRGYGVRIEVRNGRSGAEFRGASVER